VRVQRKGASVRSRRYELQDATKREEASQEQSFSTKGKKNGTGGGGFTGGYGGAPVGPVAGVPAFRKKLKQSCGTAANAMKNA